MKGDFGMNDNGANRVVEELELDERLASAAQQSVRQVVASLPDDGLSMAWRSSLNERLLVTAARQRRKAVLGWILKPAFGFGLAGGLAVVFLFHSSSPPVTTQTNRAPGLEASMVATHRENASYSEIVGVGLAPTEAVNDRSQDAPGNSEWQDVDVDTL